MNEGAVLLVSSSLCFLLVSAQTCRWPGLRDELQTKVAASSSPGHKFPYLNVAKVDILIVEMGTVSQPGERTSRS